MAYTPAFDHGLAPALFGGKDKSSIRASYGLFYTEFPGLLAGIMYSVPPFGYNYLSPAPPLFATPFITAATGVNNGQRFPFPFPPHTVSRSHSDTSIDWANFAPLSADPFFDHRYRAPYIDNYMLSVQRQITSNDLLTLSYVGNQGHRIPAVVSANPAILHSVSVSPAAAPSAKTRITPPQPARPSTAPVPDKTKEPAWEQAKTMAKILLTVLSPTPITTRCKQLSVTSATAPSSC
jgi:hypothetical protein